MTNDRDNNLFWVVFAILFIAGIVWTFASVRACMADLGFSWVTCLNLLGAVN